jgi:hypothetical protein
MVRRWQEHVERMLHDLGAWARQHPQASADEAARTVDLQLGGLRYRLVRDLTAALALDEAGADGPTLAPGSFAPVGGRTLRLLRTERRRWAGGSHEFSE